MRNLIISGLMLLAFLSPVAAEPFRLSAAEADQVTAGSGFSAPATTVTIKVALGDRKLVDKTLKLPERGRLVLNAHGKLFLTTKKFRRHITSGIRGKKLILSSGGHDLILKHWAGKERLVLVRAHRDGKLVFPKHARLVSTKGKGAHGITRTIVVNSSGGSGGKVAQIANAVATARPGTAEAAAINTFRN